MDTIADLEHFSVIFPVSLRARESAISLQNAPRFVSLVTIEIFSRAQNQPKRSAHKRKSSAETFLKVALVGRREGIQRIAVNHDGGRGVSALIRPKLRYAHPGGHNPPAIVSHGNALDALTPAYQRYLEKRFRAAFPLVGTPLRLILRTGKNPYTE